MKGFKTIIESTLDDHRTYALRKPFVDIADDISHAAWMSQTLWEYNCKKDRGYEDVWVSWTGDKAADLLGMTEYKYAQARKFWEELGVIKQDARPGHDVRVRINERELMRVLEQNGYVESNADTPAESQTSDDRKRDISDPQPEKSACLGAPNRNTKNRTPAHARSRSRSQGVPTPSTSTRASGGCAAGSPDGSPGCSPSAARGGGTAGNSPPDQPSGASAAQDTKRSRGAPQKGERKEKFQKEKKASGGRRERKTTEEILAEQDGPPAYLKIIRESKSEGIDEVAEDYPFVAELRRRLVWDWPIEICLEMNDIVDEDDALAVLEGALDPRVECGFTGLEEAERFFEYLHEEATREELERFDISGLDERVVGFHVARHAWFKVEYEDADEMEARKGIQLSVEAAEKRGYHWELGKQEAIEEKINASEYDGDQSDESMAFNVT